MKSAMLITLSLVIAIGAKVVGQAQTPNNPAVTAAASSEKPPVEIISHKIGIEYYPMLDRPSLTAPPMTAEIGELPQTENERVARQRHRGNKNTAAPIAPENARARGGQSS